MIEQYGRLLYWVSSHSRRKLRHLVDLEPQAPDRYGYVEPYACDCESFQLRGDRPCRHAIEVFEHLLPIVEHLSHWKPIPEPPKKKTREYHINAKRIPEPPTPERGLHESLPRQSTGDALKRHTGLQHVVRRAIRRAAALH